MKIPDEIRNRRGERLETSFHPGEREDALVLLGHGVTGNKDRPLLVAVAEQLAARGWPCLRFSFAGNGGSEGAFEEATVSKECEDLRDLIAQLPPGLEIAYAGHSMGAAVGVLTALEELRIKVLVSLAGMVRTREFCEREFGDVTPGEGEMWDEEGCPLSRVFVDDMASVGELLEEAARVAVPWLLVHGTADDVVFPADSRDARAAATVESELVEIEGAGHLFDEDSWPRVAEAIDGWLRPRLGGA